MLHRLSVGTQERIELLTERMIFLLSVGKVRRVVHEDHQNAFKVGLPKYSSYGVPTSVRAKLVSSARRRKAG